LYKILAESNRPVLDLTVNGFSRFVWIIYRPKVARKDADRTAPNLVRGLWQLQGSVTIARSPHQSEVLAVIIIMAKIHFRFKISCSVSIQHQTESRSKTNLGQKSRQKFTFSDPVKMWE